MHETIKSIAAFDLETTSLPTFDGFRTKITEISFVSCSVKHLNELKPLQGIPRVVHKLSVCFNPRKRIDDEATKKTGLDNFNLEQEKAFTENSGNLIKSYLEHLQQPVCLIAHNGDKFDFPILAKELQNNNITLPENIYCMDSLHAFREIETIKEKQTSDNNDKNGENGTDELQELSNDFIDNTDDLIKSDDSDNEDDKHFQQLNETTPKRKTDNSAPKRKLFSSAEGSSSKKLCQKQLLFATPKSKRKLFSNSILSPSIKSTINPNEFKKGYTLTDIYKRYYKKEPEVTHHAEADVLTLLQCIAASRKDFIPFMNGDAVLFREIKPLGTINFNK